IQSNPQLSCKGFPARRIAIGNAHAHRNSRRRIAYMHTHDEDWRQLTLIALLILVPDCGSAPDLGFSFRFCIVLPDC
ncbi:unnamed protein product, partial [Staurois parvus]